MKVTINHYAYGQELAIGTVSEEIWDYIQENYDGDTEDYLNDLCENGSIPEDLMLAESSSDMYDNDDLCHIYGGWLKSGRIEVLDEDESVIYECDCRDEDTFNSSGIKVVATHEKIDESVRYISVFSSTEKGLFKTGTFELDGEFEPKKLVILGTTVEYNGEETDVIVRGFTYDGQVVDCDFGSTDGKGLDVDIIDTQEDA